MGEVNARVVGIFLSSGGLYMASASCLTSIPWRRVQLQFQSQRSAMGLVARYSASASCRIASWAMASPKHPGGIS